MLAFIVVGILVGCVMFITFAKSGRFLRNFLGSAAMGLAGLFAGWGAGFLGLNMVTLNLFSIITAVVLGLPGVIGLMLARLMVL